MGRGASSSTPKSGCAPLPTAPHGQGLPHSPLSSTRSPDSPRMVGACQAGPGSEPRPQLGAGQEGATSSLNLQQSSVPDP